MRTTINFTAEHRDELNKLFLDLAFGGEMLSGKFGANTLSPYDILHHTSIGTLTSLRNQLKKEISAAEANDDEWSASETEQKQLSLKKKWATFIHLTIGYLKSKAEEAKNQDAIRKLDAKIANLEEATKSPEDKIAELKAKRDELSGAAATAEAKTEAVSDTTGV